MVEIPEDVLKAAIACWNSRVGRGPVVDDIALAILAERKRCAGVARKWETSELPNVDYIIEAIETGQ